MLPTPRSLAICLGLLCGILSGLHAQESPSPPRIYYLTGPVWVTIGDKSYGFGTGTQFELVQDSGSRVTIRNGNYEFEVDRALVTNDYAVAKQAYETEIAQQQEKARQQDEVAQAIKRREEREAAALQQAAQQAAQEAAKWQAEQERQAQARRIQAQWESERLLRNTPIMLGLGDKDELQDQPDRQAQINARQAQINAQNEQEADRQIRELHQKYNIPGPSRNSSGPAEQELNDLKDQLRSQQQFEQWKRQAELPLPGIDPVNNPFR